MINCLANRPDDKCFRSSGRKSFLQAEQTDTTGGGCPFEGARGAAVRGGHCLGDPRWWELEGESLPLSFLSRSDILFCYRQPTPEPLASQLLQETDPANMIFTPHPAV